MFKWFSSAIILLSANRRRPTELSSTPQRLSLARPIAMDKVLAYGLTMYQRRVEAFMLDADYYHARADLCIKLAHAALAARPLCRRLISLADGYRANAAAAAAELNHQRWAPPATPPISTASSTEASSTGQ
jgi:hypothetical protein